MDEVIMHLPQESENDTAPQLEDETELNFD